MIKLLTMKWLKDKGACQESKDEFLILKKKSIKTEIVFKMLEKKEKLNWSNWLISRLFNKKQKIQYAIYAAEQVIDIYENKYLNDNRPRKAIEAAKNYFKKPSEKNRNAAYAADAAATAAATAAASAAAADPTYTSLARFHRVPAADSTDHRTPRPLYATPYRAGRAAVYPAASSCAHRDPSSNLSICATGAICAATPTLHISCRPRFERNTSRSTWPPLSNRPVNAACSCWLDNWGSITSDGATASCTTHTRGQLARKIDIDDSVGRPANGAVSD